MPSGSHGGGGGGGHFGGGGFGGSHFGGSSGGSHFGGSYYHGPKRPGRAPIVFHYFYWGGTRYVIENDDRVKIRSKIFSAVAVFFIMLCCLFVIFASVSNVNKIKKDYLYYQDMIAYAEEHPDYMITGKIQTKYYNEDAGKWYLTYYFYTAEDVRVDGYTYSIYNDSQIKSFHSGDNIQLAVDSIPLTTETDSINYDYKNTTLWDDGEYTNAVSGIAISVVVEITLLGVMVFLIISVVKDYKKLAKKVDENGNAEIKYKYICTYCGGKLTEDDKSCPHCGSSTIETIVEKNK